MGNRTKIRGGTKVDPIWVIRIKSNAILSKGEKSLIADLIDNEAHIIEEKYSFVLHDILEDNRTSEAIIEGNRLSVINIVTMLRNNLQYDISYHYCPTVN